MMESCEIMGDVYINNTVSSKPKKRPLAPSAHGDPSAAPQGLPDPCTNPIHPLTKPLPLLRGCRRHFSPFHPYPLAEGLELLRGFESSTPPRQQHEYKTGCQHEPCSRTQHLHLKAEGTNPNGIFTRQLVTLQKKSAVLLATCILLQRHPAPPGYI